MQEYSSPGTQAHAICFSGVTELVSCKNGPWALVSLWQSADLLET